jgi:hypothetical protein
MFRLKLRDERIAEHATTGDPRRADLSGQDRADCARVEVAESGKCG